MIEEFGHHVERVVNRPLAQDRAPYRSHPPECGEDVMRASDTRRSDLESAPEIESRAPGRSASRHTPAVDRLRRFHRPFASETTGVCCQAYFNDLILQVSPCFRGPVRFWIESQVALPFDYSLFGRVRPFIKQR